MSKNFHESYQEEAIAPPSARSTGVVFAVVALIAAYFLRENLAALSVALGSAAILAMVSWLAPNLLEPLNRVWFRLSLLLNKIVSPIVMLAMFAIAIVPLGLAMQLRRDPLRRKRAPESTSYWIKRERGPDDKSSMQNQF